MNVLRKKMKKVHGAKRFFYYITSLLYALTFGYFIYGLLHLAGIETALRIVIITIFSIWFIIYLLTGIITLIGKKTKTFIIITIITLILCPIFTISSYYINKTYNSLGTMNRNTITYTTNLIALQDTNFNSSSIIGMIEAEDDIEGNELAKKLIKKENLNNKIENYEDYHTMIQDLYGGKIDACFVSSNYAITFGNEEFENQDKNIEELVKVIYEYSEDKKNQDSNLLSSSKTKKITEPFTMLIMGVDSEKDGLTANQAFNGDTLIMITFNPKTLTTTMFSLPRDLYVPIACNNNKYNKINSAAAYGSTCVINTVKNLTGISIDYYLKMNFKGVVDLVDALGGVTLEIEEPDFSTNAGIDCKGKICEQNSNRAFGNSTVFIDTGLQTINGEQALAYARCRHLFAMSDIARNQHQQDLITAMAQKVKTIRSLSDFENILNTVSKNIETNMTPEQILSFYNVGKDMLTNSNSESLSIKKTYLSYYNLTVWRGYNASSLGYYQSSMDAITDLMKINLGLKEEKDIKTFKISYNEEYETPLVGMGLTGGEKLETLPNFIGYDKDYVNNWCNEHNLTCHFEKEDSYQEANSILSQSAYQNELLKALSSVTFKYSSGNSDDAKDEENNSPTIAKPKKSTTMPDFTNYAKSYVKEWCTVNDKDCKWESKASSSPKDDVLEQDIKPETDLSNVTIIYFKYSDGTLKNDDNDKNDKDENNKDKKPTNNNDEENNQNNDSSENNENTNNDIDTAGGTLTLE